ncbi:MAG TPA: helix-hairpin-helix domain-containing protein [Planctomycetota bacterium]|nr:helix-hairpin-helix domain-containing protein [Planctomycetota bacterium]
MPLDRRAAAEALEEIAALMELKGENPFRVRAFANGARVIVGLADFEDRLAQGTLTEVKGIGQGIATEVVALARVGASPMLDALRREVPEGLRAIASVPGLGPKKARALHDDLGIRSLAELEYACRENRLKTLKGFGAKTQEKVLEALRSIARRAGLLRRDDVRVMESMADAAARKAGGRAFACGAYRRGEILAEGLDLVVAADDPDAALDAALAALPVQEVLARAKDGTARLRMRNGAEARVVAVPEGALGAALAAATGPEGHLRALGDLRRSTQKGASPGPRSWPDEAAFYADIGLPWIPPEQRGDGSEIEAARAGRLPRILERSEVLGALHAHTTWSDGSGTVAEMLDAAAAAGLAWIGISDHSPTAAYAGGLPAERLVLQQREIDAEAAKRPNLAVFKGTECDILGDGALDYPEAILARFDFVVASVHSRFTMPEAEQTARVLRAVADPHTTVLGHPTGRLLLGRDGYAVDIPEVLRACAQHGVAVELNAHPARLDLDPKWMPLVKELGVTVSIGPDAHEPAGFDDLDHGVAVARRCGLAPGQVLNARDAAGAREYLAARRRRREAR